MKWDHQNTAQVNGWMKKHDFDGAYDSIDVRGTGKISETDMYALVKKVMM